MGSAVEVLQGVVVHAVTVEDDDVLVDIYGSASNICGSVRFTFTDARKRRSMAGLLRRWAADRTPLTFIQTGTSIALQNDSAVYGEQLETQA